MQILFVHRNNHLEDTLRNSLNTLAERDSIHFCHTYHDAENFIYNNVIRNQLPLDLIICQNNIGGLWGIDFYKRIIKDKTATFSNGHFYFHTIPVVLIADPGENIHALTRVGFADVFDSTAMYYLHLYTEKLANVVKQWRRKLFDDLSNIGIHYEKGRLVYGYSQSEKKRLGIYTTTLSDAYKMEPHSFTYEWMTTSERQIEIGIGKLEKEMKRACRMNTREEYRIADLFRQYPFLVKRDNYSEFWQEKRLPLEGRKFYRLDVTLKPNFDQVADLAILELKLPNEAFIKGGVFHPTLRQNVIRNISQVNDYKEWFESNSRDRQISDTFGFVPRKIQYNVLMGRIEDKERHFKILNKRLQEFNAGHINLVTYDEFMDTDLEYFKRRLLLNV